MIYFHLQGLRVCSCVVSLKSKISICSSLCLNYSSIGLINTNVLLAIGKLERLALYSTGSLCAEEPILLLYSSMFNILSKFCLKVVYHVLLTSCWEWESWFNGPEFSHWWAIRICWKLKNCTILACFCRVGTCGERPTPYVVLMSFCEINSISTVAQR